MADREGKRLQYLNDLSDYKIAEDDPDVRGWTLVDANDERVGTVDNLLVDMTTEKVRYLDVDVDESLLSEDHEPLRESDPSKPHEFITRTGETHMIVPIGMARLDRENQRVISSEVNKEKYARTRRVNRGATITPDYERDVVATLVGPSGIPGTSRNADKDMLRTDENFYNSRYFNEDSFFGRDRNTVR